MFEDLKEEEIVNKVGGRFKLSTLIQKRMVALNTGAKPLIDARGITDKMQIVLHEFLEDKIYLDTAGNVQVRNATMGIELATRACELSGWEDWTCVLTLAAAHAQTGAFDQAVRLAQQAMALAPEESQADCRRQLQRCQSGQPYR